jgi:hypothetical protein
MVCVFGGNCREEAMGQLIEYYIPESHVLPQEKWVPPSARGKVLGFERGMKPKAMDPRIVAAALKYNWMSFAPPR